MSSGVKPEEYGTAGEVVDMWASHINNARFIRSESGMSRKGILLSYKGRVIASRITGVTLISAKYKRQESRAIGLVQRKLVDRKKQYCFVPIVHGFVAALMGKDGQECTISLKVRTDNMRYLRSRIWEARQNIVNRRTTFEQLPARVYHYEWWTKAAKVYAVCAEIQYGEEFEPLADYVYRHNAKLFAIVAMDDPKMKVLTC